MAEIRREAVAQQQRYSDAYQAVGEGGEAGTDTIALDEEDERALRAMQSHANSCDDTTVTQSEIAELMSEGTTSELELCLCLTERKGRRLFDDEKLLIGCCVLTAQIFKLRQREGGESLSKQAMVAALQKFRGRPLGQEEMEVVSQLYEGDSGSSDSDWE